MTDRQIARQWGGAIRAQRMRKKMSVAALAEAVGVTRAAVYQWESGDALPSPAKQVRIADALEVHPHLLFLLPAAA